MTRRASECVRFALVAIFLTLPVSGANQIGNPVSHGTCANPIFVSQPLTQAVNSGHEVTLRVAVTAPMGPFSYQWYEGTTGDTTTPVGTDSPAYTTPAMLSTTPYWVRVTNCGGSSDSNTATVIVSAKLRVDYPTAIGPNSVEAGDFDRNGIVDIAVGTNESKVAVFLARIIHVIFENEIADPSPSR